MIRFGMSGMFVLMLAAVFVAGSTAGANAHGNETALEQTRTELSNLTADTNLSDSGAEGAYKDYVLRPTFETAEVVAVSSYEYGYNHPTQAKVLGYTVQGVIYMTIVYYLHKGYKLIKTGYKK